jgi:methanogenic corrinoid protein MtbC1
VADALDPVIDELGRRWEVGEITVLHEHLASERLARALARVADDHDASPHAPRCLLITAQGDEHTLGLSLVEVCLREAGWLARWAGRRTPIEHVRQYIERGEVRMVAISASIYSTDAPILATHAERIGAVCERHGVRLLLGGKGLWPDPPPYGRRIRSFAQLYALLSEAGDG